MAHEWQGWLTVSGSWADHLRNHGKRLFWKRDRNTARRLVRKEKS